MKSRAIGIMGLTVAALFCDRCWGQTLADLPPAARDEFNTLRAEWSEFTKKYKDVQRRAEQQDPLLRLTTKYGQQAEYKRADAREKTLADQAGFVKKGRGDESKFTDWQAAYGEIANMRSLEAKLADPTVRPILLWHMRDCIERAKPATSDRAFPVVWPIEDMSPEQILEQYRVLMVPDLDRDRKWLDAVEPLVRPTQQEREHVRDYEWWRSIISVCNRYIEGSKPQGELKKLVRAPNKTGCL